MGHYLCKFYFTKIVAHSHLLYIFGTTLFYVYSSSVQLSVSSTFVVVSTSVVLETCVVVSILTVELSSLVVVS